MQEKRYFEPTESIAWLIGNSDYFNLREAGILEIENIPQAHEDVVQMIEFF